MDSLVEKNTTGEICQISGIYFCVGHPQKEIPFSKGEKFPSCLLEGQHFSIWILRREV